LPRWGKMSVPVKAQTRHTQKLNYLYSTGSGDHLADIFIDFKF